VLLIANCLVVVRNLRGSVHPPTVARGVTRRTVVTGGAPDRSKQLGRTEVTLRADSGTSHDKVIARLSPVGLQAN
jgi:hypothetical protein